MPIEIKSNAYTRNLLVILILILCFAGNILYHFMFRNAITQPALPAKYAAYKSLDEPIASANYEIKRLFSHNIDNVTFAPPHYYPKEQITMVYSTTDENQPAHINTYYRFDTSGHLIDSMASSNEYLQLSNGYLIHPHYYYSWILNGDTARQSYIPINNDLKLDSLTLQSRFYQLTETASQVHFVRYSRLWEHNSDAYQHKTDEVLFLKNNKWYALFGKDLYRYKTDELPETNLLPNMVPPDTGFDKSGQTIYLDKFYKQYQLGSPDSWFGTGYINLIIKTDTLRIKGNVLMMGDNLKGTKRYNNQLNYYTNSQLQFGILTDSLRKYYVVQPKIK